MSEAVIHRDLCHRGWLPIGFEEFTPHCIQAAKFEVLKRASLEDLSKTVFQRSGTDAYGLANCFEANGFSQVAFNEIAGLARIFIPLFPADAGQTNPLGISQRPPQIATIKRSLWFS